MGQEMLWRNLAGESPVACREIDGQTVWKRSRKRWLNSEGECIEEFKAKLFLLVRFTQGIFGNDPAIITFVMSSSQQPPATHPLPGTVPGAKYVATLWDGLPSGFPGLGPKPYPKRFRNRTHTRFCLLCFVVFSLNILISTLNQFWISADIDFPDIYMDMSQNLVSVHTKISGS